MSWHKHQEYDPTAAFIANNRQQKLLELKLEEIDKLWFSQLKHIAKERLETTIDLGKLESEKQKLKYFDNNMDNQEIKEHGEYTAKKLKKVKTETKRDNFNFDQMRERSSISVPMSLHLPRLEKQLTMCSLSKGNKRHTKKTTKKKRKSKLKTTRVFSVSDPNLHKSTKSDEKDSLAAVQEANQTRTVTNVRDGFSNLTDKFLPLLRPAGEGKSADYRYLKQRMATTAFDLPPVSENTQRRKLSI